MNNNEFFISDASYCCIEKIATIASMCPKKGIKKSLVLENIDSINTAETLALLLSIKLAIKYKISNAVFIYDNNHIDKSLIENTFKESFDCIQLLWVKRDLIKPVDKLARQTFEEIVYGNKEKDKNTINNLVNLFTKYDDKLKIKAAMKIATIKEYRVLDTYLKNAFKVNSLHEVKLKDTNLVRFVYQVLSKEEKKKFYNYLEKVVPKTKAKKQFKQLQKNEVLFKFIRQINEKAS